ncbi:hypothetical protein WUBG_00145 [Wuchereria bancrofti]|uniref:Uncharacterized protein n=1 Tax=Wuchereria bancrofti TaxID=6293 RepID=J9BMX8_WUCBA|nr:hypothetical protein WUBG_00145 [Wuchereria bancrofti]
MEAMSLRGLISGGRHLSHGKRIATKPWHLTNRGITVTYSRTGNHSWKVGEGKGRDWKMNMECVRMVIPRRRDQYVLPVLTELANNTDVGMIRERIIPAPEQNGLVCQTTREMMDDMWCEDVGREEIDQSCKIVEDGDSVYR